MSTVYSELEQQVRGWVAPLSEAAPAGTEPYADPRYHAVKQEIAKIANPSAGAADWKEVVVKGGDLLLRSSKELMVATAVAHALHVLHGEDGLAAGLILVTDLTDSFWAKLFPATARGMKPRVNAVRWLLDRSNARLATAAKIDRTSYGRLAAASVRFSEVVGAKFGSDSPLELMGGLRRQIDRLKPAETAEPAAAAAVAEKSADSAAPAPASAPIARAVSAAVAPPPAPAPRAETPPPVAAPVEAPAAAGVSFTAREASGPEDAQRFLREVGAAIARTAHLLRRANPANPAAYRLLRTGVWLHLSERPAVNAAGKTAAAGLSAAERKDLQDLTAKNSWAALLERAETLLPNRVYCLDLHRCSAAALRGLGPAHEAAHAALLAEVGTFLARMTGLTELQDRDGAPFADAATKAWLDAELAPAGGPRGGPSLDAHLPAPSAPLPALPRTPADAEDPLMLANGRPIQEAVALIQARCATASNAEDRFRLRLGLASAAARSGKLDLAQALFDALDRECVARGLEEWAPALASACLREHLECLRALGRRGNHAALDVVGQGLYRRLCWIDPGAALEVAR